MVDRGDSHRGQRRFSGQPRGKSYSWARYYHPGLQRFLSEDPLDVRPPETNLYAYTLNNPLNLVDPFGLYTEQELTAIIYNETSGLRGNLADARVAIARVAVNRERLGIRGGVATPEMSAAADLALQRNDPAAVAAYLDSLRAAALVLSGRPPCGVQDPTRGATHYILDFGQRKPSWARGVPRLNYGPFINAGGGGDVPRRATVHIQIYP